VKKKDANIKHQNLDALRLNSTCDAVRHKSPRRGSDKSAQGQSAAAQEPERETRFRPAGAATNQPRAERSAALG
jgi:hypothetical protein